MVGYTTRSVSDYIGISEGRVRRYVREGLLEPSRDGRGRFNFEFQDVVLMRTAKRLLDARVSAYRTLRLLLKLKANLKAPVKSTHVSSHQLAGMRIYATGSHVMVKNEASLWDADSGQVELDFDVSAQHFALTALHGPDLIDLLESEELDSDDWYNLGLDLEEMDLERAPEAYAKAIELDAMNVDAHVNLGRLCQMRGQFEIALEHYADALRLCDDHQLANYNMGTLFDESGHLDEACEFYLKATQVPDAHYNLARLFDIKGDELSARRHLREYSKLETPPL